MPSNPIPTQYAALHRFATQVGRYWKRDLRECWRTGNYPWHTNTDDQALLRQVRNQLGPSWLNSYLGIKPSVNSEASQ